MQIRKITFAAMAGGYAYSCGAGAIGGAKTGHRDGRRADVSTDE